MNVRGFKDKKLCWIALGAQRKTADRVFDLMDL